MNLDKIKTDVERMDKTHQLEILKIIHKYEPATINENKSGVFMNLSTLMQTTVEEMIKYIEHVQTLDLTLNIAEQQKDEFKHSYFDNNLKQDKDEKTSLYSYQG